MEAGIGLRMIHLLAGLCLIVTGGVLGKLLLDATAAESYPFMVSFAVIGGLCLMSGFSCVAAAMKGRIDSV